MTLFEIKTKNIGKGTKINTSLEAKIINFAYSTQTCYCLEKTLTLYSHSS